MDYSGDYTYYSKYRESPYSNIRLVRMGPRSYRVTWTHNDGTKDPDETRSHGDVVGIIASGTWKPKLPASLKLPDGV